MKKTRDLFWTFLKIGAFTFGGGYAMVALLEREFVEDKQWLSREEFLDNGRPLRSPHRALWR